MKLINVNFYQVGKVALYITLTFYFLTTTSFGLSQEKENPKNKNIFSKSNLVAWCIVPFDIKKRGPEERAQMMVKLGIKKFAYDWRDEHVKDFDKEMIALKKYNIELQAFWMPFGLDVLNDKHYAEILSLLKRQKIKTQLWWSCGSSILDSKDISQKEKIATISKIIKKMAQDAASIGCTVGLYNHNGWFGEPENQLEIIGHVKMKNVGIVYNFNHAEDHTETFKEFFPKILPHLIALNIAGIKKGPPGKVVAVGQGDSEELMMQIIAQSKYTGTIGIINEDTDPDAEKGLIININGLKKILKNLGYDIALKTYQ